MRLRGLAAGVVALAITSASPAAAQTVPPPSPTPSAPPAPTPSPPLSPHPKPPKLPLPSKPTRPSRPRLVPRPPVERGPSKSDKARRALAPTRQKHRAKRKKAKKPTNEIWWTVGYQVPGTFSTARLLDAARQLRNLGAESRRARDVFQPFIVAGYARWWDSWGEVRLATHGLRPHLGQDVFCNQSAPVLAPEPGRIEFALDDLGGMVARLHREVGGYFYYAHLSGYNAMLSSGDHVARGDIIGYCGNTGNAQSTPPHVHFGLYSGGVAQNPMPTLVAWLHAAERRAARLLRRSRPKAAKPDTAADPVRVPSDPKPLDLTSLSCDPLPYPVTAVALILGEASDLESV